MNEIGVLVCYISEPSLPFANSRVKYSNEIYKNLHTTNEKPYPKVNTIHNTYICNVYYKFL